MKKALILIVFSLLITGCTLEYKLTIKSNKFVENVSITAEKNILGIEGTEAIKNMEIPAIGTDNYYEKKMDENSQEIKLNYTYQYSKNQISNSYLINNCYSKLELIEEDGDITMSTKGRFLCYDMLDTDKIDKVNIVIQTSQKVKEHNADEVKGSKYIWTIDQSNYTNKPIYIKMKSSQGFILTNHTITMLIISGVIVIGGLLVSGYVMIRRKNNNKV